MSVVSQRGHAVGALSEFRHCNDIEGKLDASGVSPGCVAASVPRPHRPALLLSAVLSLERMLAEALAERPGSPEHRLSENGAAEGAEPDELRLFLGVGRPALPCPRFVMGSGAQPIRPESGKTVLGRRFSSRRSNSSRASAAQRWGSSSQAVWDRFTPLRGKGYRAQQRAYYYGTGICATARQARGAHGL